jgi:hypothetical protein
LRKSLLDCVLSRRLAPSFFSGESVIAPASDMSDSRP